MDEELTTSGSLAGGVVRARHGGRSKQKTNQILFFLSKFAHGGGVL